MMLGFLTGAKPSAAAAMLSCPRMTSKVVVGIIVALAAALIAGVTSALLDGWLIQLLGGATPSYVTEEISRQALGRSAAQSGWIRIPSSQLYVPQSVTFQNEFPGEPAILLLPSSVVGADDVSPEFFIEATDARGFRFRVLPADGLQSLQVTWLAVTQTILLPAVEGQRMGSRVGAAAAAPR